MTIDLENTGIMRLERGAMQNWSDVGRGGAHASAALRSVVETLVDAGDSVLVVGPTAIDVVTEVAAVAGSVTVVCRSIPDGAVYADALTGVDGAQVICGDLLNLSSSLGRFDLVLVLDDLARVPSLEDASPTWADVYAAVVEHVRHGGRLALAVENELGLHRITSLRSRYTSDDDGAWDVIATFDATRPRSRESLLDVVRSGELTQTSVADLLPTWDEHTLLAWNAKSCDTDERTVLDAVTLSSPALRRLGADPTRVTRAAVLAGRLGEFASGWLIVAGRDVAPASGLRILASTTTGQVETYESTAEGMRTGTRSVSVPAGAVLFAEEALDACASGDAARFRALVQRWWEHAEAASREGKLAPEVADLRFDTLLDDGSAFVHIRSASRPSAVDDAAWSAIVDFVEVIRARGARHLWPAAMDDRTMAATIGAMAGLRAPADLDALVGERSSMLALPAQDVSGLLAVIERLEAKNAALASRATWFESRLNARERELRGRAQRQQAELALANRQQETLRKSAEDLRRSLTYRLGNVAMGPLKEAKRRITPNG